MEQELIILEIQKLTNMFLARKEEQILDGYTIRRNREWIPIRELLSSKDGQAIHVMGIPPEYRCAYSKGEEIHYHEAGMVYSLMADIFCLITGSNQLPLNFRLSNRWRYLLQKACRDWPKEKRDAVMSLFCRNTKCCFKERCQTLDELLQLEGFQQIVS